MQIFTTPFTWHMQEKLKYPITKTRLPLIELQLIVHQTAKLFVTSLQKNNPNAITGQRNIDKHIFMRCTNQNVELLFSSTKKKNIKLLHILTLFFFQTPATQTKQLIQKLS